MANKSSSKSAEAYYARYKVEKRWETNRLKKLERALKRNPNNAVQIELAMKGLVYRRKTPATRMWSASKRRTAQVFKRFSGKAQHDLFSSNEKVQSAALMLPGTAVKSAAPANWLSMSSLAARAHDKTGQLVWG